MARWEDVHRIATAFPEVEQHQSGAGVRAWRVRGRLFAWERPLRKADHAELGDAAPDDPPLAAYVPDFGAKEALLSTEPEVYFTTSHFDGYRIVLVRLDRIAAPELTELLTDAWLDRAPRRLAKEFLADR